MIANHSEWHCELEITQGGLQCGHTCQTRKHVLNSLDMEVVCVKLHRASATFGLKAQCRQAIDKGFSMCHLEVRLTVQNDTWFLTPEFVLLNSGVHASPPSTSVSFSRVLKGSGPCSDSSSVGSGASSPSGASLVNTVVRPVSMPLHVSSAQLQDAN